MTNTTPAPTDYYRMSAHFDYRQMDSAVPQDYELVRLFATVEEARAAAAALPKTLKARATTHSSWDRETGESLVLGILILRSRLSPDGTNGGVNETGIRRYRSTLRALAGTEIRFERNCGNGYETREAFEAALGI